MSATTSTLSPTWVKVTVPLTSLLTGLVVADFEGVDASPMATMIGAVVADASAVATAEAACNAAASLSASPAGRRIPCICVPSAAGVGGGATAAVCCEV